jgi:ferredoxin-NADP reductase
MHSDAIVVGAGVMGSSIALELARSGRRVVVVDKAGVVGHGSTSASSAVMRFNFSTWSGVATAGESKFPWENWAEHLGSTGGNLAEYVRSGVLFLDRDHRLLRSRRRPRRRTGGLYRKVHRQSDRPRRLLPAASLSGAHDRHGHGLTVADSTFELRLVVAERRSATEGVAELLLRHADGGTLPAWRPGAHIDLVLDPGLVRQYSLCGDPEDRHTWRIAILHQPAGRGGSALAHDRLTPGEQVLVRGPRNHFPFEPAPRCLFIAGGIGITPLIPMIAAADSIGVQWRLLYGGRTRRSMAFADELAQYGDAVSLRPRDEHGPLDLDAFLGGAATGTSVYCCGPEPLLRAVEQRCAHWEPGTFHAERFSPPAAPAQAATGRADEAPFEVELARSGTVLTIQPGISILSTLLDAGLNPAYSCTEGICGSCETDVLEGEVDHRDSVLTEAERRENSSMMICVSRARTARLVLDV